MKLAIFDMDGTLFNTNEINYNAYKKALEPFGVSLDYEFFCSNCNGRHYKVFLPVLLDDDLEKVEKVHNLKKQYYSKFLNKVKINSHLFEIINRIKENYKIALVTTASKKNTMDILEFTNKKDVFDLILTSEDIKNAKPDPEGFLLAMKNFNANPSETIIFEDSNVGLDAAFKTNATVFKVEKF